MAESKIDDDIFISLIGVIESLSKSLNSLNETTREILNELKKSNGQND